MIQKGKSEDVTEAYQQFIQNFNKLSEQEQKAYKQNIRKRQVGRTDGQ